MKDSLPLYLSLISRYKTTFSSIPNCLDVKTNILNVTTEKDFAKSLKSNTDILYITFEGTSQSKFFSNKFRKQLKASNMFYCFDISYLVELEQDTKKLSQFYDIIQTLGIKRLILKNGQINFKLENFESYFKSTIEKYKELDFLKLKWKRNEINKFLFTNLIAVRIQALKRILKGNSIVSYKKIKNDLL
eukprot:GAHX01002764.1.p1 GENE.GAHX01002764.1~~GAHX01002764.1.p1  ORF type:complete len:189 (-),score=39.77 GAHX01002764.1:31-597(-)